MSLQIRNALGAIQNEPLFDPSYRATTTGFAYLTANSGVDISFLAGSGTNVVRLKRLLVTLIGSKTAVTTRTGDLAFALVKRSALDTSAANSAMTISPMDSASSAAAATAFTLSATTPANGATGTGYGTIGAISLGVNAASGVATYGGIPNTAQFVWNFTEHGDQAPVLRLATECFGLQVSDGGTVPTNATIDVEWQFEEGTT